MVARRHPGPAWLETVGWWATAAALGLTALRTRQRVARLAVIPATSSLDHEPVEPGAVVVAEGVVVDRATRASVALHARRHGLDAVDLIPADLPVERALDLLRTTDPAQYRTTLQAPPGGCQVLHLTTELAERAGLEAGDGLDRADLLVAGEHAKKAARGRADLALVPGLRAGADDPVEGFRQMHATSGYLVPAVVCGQAIGCGVLALGAWRAVRSRTWASLAPLAAYSSQGVVAFAGTNLVPRDLWSRTALRLPRRAVDLVRTTSAMLHGDQRELLRYEEQRPVYEALMAGGTERFLHPRRPDCPMCGSTDLRVTARMGDLRLAKPGTFALERCGACDHIFQNPMLNDEGLAFYYRDAYDGLSERNMDVLFGQAGARDRRRAERLEAHTVPRRWLDIGGSHGHFCLEARQVLPHTEFHALDMAASVEVAERRGWVDRSHRGQIGDHVDELSGAFDVVSMHHYLEHTVDPREELTTAASFLAPGGHLLVEVPNGHSPLARVFGGLWFNWVAPQHLHFMPQENLEAELETLGFEIVERQGHEAHIFGIDFVASLANAVNRLVPPVQWPWLPPRTTGGRVKRAAAVVAAVPFVPFALVLDVATLAHARITGRGNSYGVIARRVVEAEPAADTRHAGTPPVEALA